MPNSPAAKATANRCTLEAYFQREQAPLVERYDLAKRILAAVARRHEAGRPAGRLEGDSVLLTGLRSFRVELLDEGPVSGVRRKGAHEDLEDWSTNDVRVLGKVLSRILPDADLPRPVALVLAAMKNGGYDDARLAMNAFARAVP